MPNTPGGIPYPSGTDFVVDGDNAMAAMAQAVDSRVMYGGTILVRQSAAQVGFTSSAWLAMPFDTSPMGQSPGFVLGVRWDPTNRQFIIHNPGIYMVWATITMNTGTYVMRIKQLGPAVRTMAVASGSATSYTSSASAVAYLPNSTGIQVQILSTSGTIGSPADTIDNPVMMGITHLPYIP